MEAGTHQTAPQAKAKAKAVPGLGCTPKRRKLTPVDAEQIAELVAASRNTETEACLVLGINPGQWFSYKAKKRAGTGFDMLLTKIRGAAIHFTMERIKAKGKKDWRADQYRLGLLAPERFGNQQSAPQPMQANVVVMATMDQLKRIYVPDNKQLEPAQVGMAAPATLLLD